MKYEYFNEKTEEYEVLDVDYEISPFTPENRNGHPDNWYPAEGGDIESLTIYRNGVDITAEIPEPEIRLIEDQCFEDAERIAAENREPDFDFEPEYY